MTVLPSACLAAAVVLLLCAGAFDLLFRTIPNWVAGALACDGAVLHAAGGTLMPATLAALAVFAACAVLWRCGALGGGDVKLFGAAALAVPAAGAFVAATMLAGGAMGLTYAGLRLVVRGRPARPAQSRAFLVRILRIERRRVAAGSLPYGCAIAAGAVLAWAGA